MKMVLKSPNEAPYEAGKDFSVVVSFDDSTTAERVSNLLQLIKKKLEGEDGRLFHQWWNIEVLAFNQLREMAAVEAAAADMIIVGIRAGTELPEMVGSWMKRLISLRKDRPGALVAVLDPDQIEPGVMQSILSQLKQVAALGHLDFLVTGAKEDGDAGMARNAGEAACQFVMSHKNRTPCGLSAAT